jgi:uncharacterized protein (DUF2147 family)
MELPFVSLRSNRFLFRGLLIAACGMCLTFFGSQSFGASPLGLWYAEGGAAEVQVFPCAGEFCGKVVWLRSPLGEDGCELRDDKNPDSTLRSRAIIGLVVLTGLKPVDDDHAAWSGGSIYDPATGHTYSCIARLEGNGRLFLRGYFGIQLLGRTTTWTRVAATQCHSVDR